MHTCILTYLHIDTQWDPLAHFKGRGPLKQGSSRGGLPTRSCPETAQCFLRRRALRGSCVQLWRLPDKVDCRKASGRSAPKRWLWSCIIFDEDQQDLHTGGLFTYARTCILGYCFLVDTRPRIQVGGGSRIAHAFCSLSLWRLAQRSA